MKKIFYIFIIIIIAFSACIKNYDDGPFISFRSTSKLLLKTWTVEQFLVDNIDSTKLYYDSCGCDINFNNREGDDPQFRLTMNCINDSVTNGGHFSYNSKSLTFHQTGYPYVIPFISNSKWSINRLTKHDLWMESSINGKSYYLKLKAK